MSGTIIRMPSAKENLLRYLKDQHYSFVTTTPLTHQRVNARHDHAPGVTLRDAFGWNRPFQRELLPDTLFDALQESAVILPVEAGWKSKLRASFVGNDLFLHSGFPTSEPDAVFLGPDTYRFCRLIRQTLGQGASLRRAVDIGCGTGAGGVAVARNAACEELAWTDINERALDLCRANLRVAGIPNPHIVNSDLFESLEGEFNLIVANPPYLNDTEQRAYRHGGGALGSQLSVRIAVDSVGHLTKSGRLILYTGSPIVEGEDRFKAAIEAELKDAPVKWSYEEIDPDVFGEELELTPYQRVERIAVVALVMTKVGDG